VAAALDGAPTVQQRAAALDERLRLVDGWADALSDLDQARTQLAIRTGELAAAVTEHGFEDVTAVRRAHLGPSALEALERQVDEHRGALARTEAGLAEPEIRALDELPPDAAVNLAGAEAAYVQAQQHAGAVAA